MAIAPEKIITFPSNCREVAIAPEKIITFPSNGKETKIAYIIALGGDKLAAAFLIVRTE